MVRWICTLPGRYLHGFSRAWAVLGSCSSPFRSFQIDAIHGWPLTPEGRTSRSRAVTPPSARAPEDGISGKSRFFWNESLRTGVEARGKFCPLRHRDMCSQMQPKGWGCVVPARCPWPVDFFSSRCCARITSCESLLDTLARGWLGSSVCSPCCWHRGRSSPGPAQDSAPAGFPRHCA